METIEGIPNSITALRSTWFFVNDLTPPARLAVPTINNELVVANNGFIPIRYTNTGTVSIEPPPPIIPNEMPINIDARYPRISMS